MVGFPGFTRSLTLGNPSPPFSPAGPSLELCSRITIGVDPETMVMTVWVKYILSYRTSRGEEHLSFVAISQPVTAMPRLGSVRPVDSGMASFPDPDEEIVTLCREKNYPRYDEVSGEALKFSFVRYLDCIWKLLIKMEASTETVVS